MINLMQIISGVVSPVVKLIDELHTSEEEKLALKTNMISVQNAMAIELLKYETKLLKYQADIIKAEATGKSWIQRSWRPLTMVAFVILVICDAIGVLPFRLSHDAWRLIQLGLGGYVFGRSAEKITPRIEEAIAKRKE